MANTYSAGIVTAYGAAVRGGYTGTYEEFCAQQAAFAENAEQVSEDRAAVEQIKNTFENQTVPAAVQQVTQAGASQVQAVQAAGDDEESDISAAGSTQVQAVQSAGSTQVQAVQTAGATQVTAVQGAGTTQVAAVNAAGATQVDAVEDKGEEVLASIPQDYSALSGEVDDLKSAINYKTPDVIRYRGLDIVPGSVFSSNGTDYDDEDTVLWYRRNQTPVFLKKGTIINFLPHYRGRVFGYNTQAVSSFNQVESGWLAGTPYTTPNDGYYRIVIGLIAADWPSRNIADWQIDGVEIYWSESGKAFADFANQHFPVSNAFVNGEPLNFKKQAIYSRRLNISLPPESITSGLTSRQDFAIYKNTLVQMFTPSYCAIMDMETGNIIAHFPITCGHANSVQFGTTFYNSSDPFPLLYCFDYDTAKIYVNRLTTAEATLIKTIELSATGYRFSGGVDDENGLLYILNYTANSSTVATNNGCVFSVWDISGNTPTLLRTEKLNMFIPVISGCVYKDGYLWVYSGSLNDDNYGIYKIDPFGNVVSWYRDTSYTGEAEGLDFWEEENSLNRRLLFADLYLHEVYYL